MKPVTYNEGKYTIEIDEDGDKWWYYKRKYHREDGPAVEFLSGSKHWFIHGKRHREDGPAIEFHRGDKEWWLNGEQYTEAEWKKEMRRRKMELLGL